MLTNHVSGFSDDMHCSAEMKRHVQTNLLTIIKIMKTLQIIRYSAEQLDINFEISHSRAILHTGKSEYVFDGVRHRKPYRDIEAF